MDRYGDILVGVIRDSGMSHREASRMLLVPEELLRSVIEGRDTFSLEELHLADSVFSLSGRGIGEAEEVRHVSEAEIRLALAETRSLVHRLAEETQNIKEKISLLESQMWTGKEAAEKQQGMAREEESLLPPEEEKKPDPAAFPLPFYQGYSRVREEDGVTHIYRFGESDASGGDLEVAFFGEDGMLFFLEDLDDDAVDLIRSFMTDRNRKKEELTEGGEAYVRVLQ